MDDQIVVPEMWDDWTDYRDGMRYNKDRKSIRSPLMWPADRLEIEKYNKKNKEKLKIRKARKEKKKIRGG